MSATVARSPAPRLPQAIRGASTEEAAKWERIRDYIRDRLVQGDYRRAPKSDQYLADNVRDDRVQCVTHLTRLLRHCRCPERVGATIIALFGRTVSADAPLPVLHTRETAVNGRLEEYQVRDLTGELQLPDYAEYIDAAWQQAEESRALAIALERTYLARIGMTPLVPLTDDYGREVRA